MNIYMIGESYGGPRWTTDIEEQCVSLKKAKQIGQWYKQRMQTALVLNTVGVNCGKIREKS